MATKKVVHKSNAPIYAIGITWVLYWISFTGSFIGGIIKGAIAAAVVGIVVKLLCKDQVEEVEVPNEEVQQEEVKQQESTGNADLDKMITDGQMAIEELKRLDRNIEDEKISAQIVKLEQLSQKIFDHVKENPEKLSQIRKFMNYYLPTTLKLLNAYDRMGEAGVNGENIAGAMERVEGIMDTIIKAFEKQLDSLYGSEAMDITSEISAMETIMAREGLIDDGMHASV